MAQFLSLEDAARKLGISPSELREKAQHREIRAFQDAGSWRFRAEDIEELSRKLGMGSDPDLSLSDLDLEVPPDSDLDLSNFQLGVATPDPDVGSSQEVKASGTGDRDVLLDDMSVPPEITGSSSTIIGMKPAGKQPSDSDVKLMPEQPGRGSSDSDVRLAQKGVGRPSDSDVTLVSDDTGDLPASAPYKGGAPAAGGFDPNETTLRPSPLLGSSGEVPSTSKPTSDSDSDFELTPSSVIDALQPDSGSDFELTALEGSDEFEASKPGRSPSDSDVTGAVGSVSGVNLGRPTDSGINLVGGIDLGSAESIELAPIDEDRGSKAAKPRKPAAKADPGATSLPIKPEKDIFEDTDFEVEALSVGGDDNTMQLEATSDFELEESESGSEVFAVDEEEVDQNAATAMGATPFADEEFESSQERSAEIADAWDVSDAEAEPVSAASSTTTPRAEPRVLASAAGPEWGIPWVVLLGLSTLIMLIGTFVSFDLISNFAEFRGDGPASGLVRTIAGLFGS